MCERENPKASDVLTEGAWLCKKCCKKSIYDCGKQVYDKEHITVNELLAYVSFYFLNSSADAIKHVLRDFYHPKEVSDAKSLLWQVEKDNLPAMVTRQDSDLRSAKEADIADIVNAFKKLDSENVDLPEFVCRNMDRVPKYGPEEIDLSSIVDRLTAVESKISRISKIESHLSTIERSTDKNRDSIDTLFHFYYQSNSMAATLKSGDSSTPPDKNPPSTSTTKEKPAQDKSDSTSIQRPAQAQGQGIKNTEPESLAGKEKSADGDGFRYSKHETRKKRREAVYGKRSQAPNGSLRGAPQTLDIFMFRCDKGTNCDRVKKYIEENSTKVIDIECVSSENARYRSFHVSVPRDSHDKVMDGEFWPEGVGVRYFKRRKSQFADNDSRNGGP